MEEEHLRKMAIEQFLKGKSPISIYGDLGRSKPWFYKWLHRYPSGQDEWFKDESKAPHHPNKTPEDTQKLVRNIRLQLEEHPFAQIGVSAIQWELRKLGAPPPPDWTINRILKREGLVKKNSLYPQRSRIPLFREALGVNNIHQADLLGPRYIKNDGRFYSLHIMDLYRHRVFIHPQRRKDDDSVALGLLRCWKTMGLPDFLQLDNERSFRGSNRYPRSLGGLNDHSCLVNMLDGQIFKAEEIPQ